MNSPEWSYAFQACRNAASLAETSALNMECKAIDGEYLLAGTSQPSLGHSAHLMRSRTAADADVIYAKLPQLSGIRLPDTMNPNLPRGHSLQGTRGSPVPQLRAHGLTRR
jgi:hypothetical protein